MSNPFVRRLRRLTDLAEADLQRLCDLFTASEPVAADRVVFDEGAASGFLHVVLEGWACRYRLLSDGRRQFPALLLPGDVCDLDRLLVDRLSFGVVTLTPCRMARLPLAKVRALLDGVAALQRAFWWLTFVEKAVANEWAVCLGRRSALERLAHLICELQARLAVVDGAERDGYALPLTQDELADTLGLSVVHLHRQFASLRLDGLVSLEERRLSILNPEALAQLCDFKPAYLHLQGLRTA